MILDKIVDDKKIRLKEHKQIVSYEEMIRLSNEQTREPISFKEALKKPGLSIIGEFKKASPSLGAIYNRLKLTDRIDQYNEAVDAVSCLTEEDHFNGNVDYLKQIRSISPLPILRKDFIIDEYQIYEAKVIGADAILLIAAILDDERLKSYYDLAHSLSLDVLLEVHDEAEMDRALAIDAEIIGINNRNLKNFKISLNTTKRLCNMICNDTIAVSESGVLNDDDIRYLKDCGVDALLIGRAFMESNNPKLLAGRWKKIFNE